MAINDLAPGFVKLFYVANSNQHVCVLPTSFAGTPTVGSEPALLRRDSLSVAAGDAVAALIAVLTPIHHTSSVFTGYEVYSKSVGGDPQFIFGEDLNEAGDAGGAAVVSGQAVWTFRTNQGGVMKFYQMESTQAVNQRLANRAGAANYQVICAQFLSNSNPWIGRDGGYPISGIWWTTKTNDALRKRQLLDQ